MGSKKDYMPRPHILGEICGGFLRVKHGGTSPYSLAAEVLERDGIHKSSPTKTDKVFVIERWPDIARIIGIPVDKYFVSKSVMKAASKAVKRAANRSKESQHGVGYPKYLNGPVTITKYEYADSPPKTVKYGRVNVASDKFLESYEWRKIRLVALKMHGRKCQCCGASPETGAVMNVDHIKPRKLFPELALDINNLQVLCHECNHGKGNWDMTDFRTAKTV